MHISSTNNSCLLAHTEFVFADRVQRVQDDNEAEDTNDDDDDDDDEDDENEADNEDENEYDEDNDDNEEDENNIMPPKLKSPPKPKQPAKAPRKQDDAGVDTIVSSVAKKLKITGLQPFSLIAWDPFMIKYYTHKFEDFVEVEFFVNGVLPEHGYRAELSADGMSLKWRRSIPNYFFESKRMMVMLEREYHHNDSRFIAHNNVV